MSAAGTLRRAGSLARGPARPVLAAVAAALVTLVFVAVSGKTQASQAQEVQQIASGLHCPICKDLSVADSPAPLALQMRQQIAVKVRAGESADQIRAGFVAAYGDSVLMSPPGRGLAGTAYFLPALVLLAGLIAAGVLLRRWLRAPRAEPDTADAGPPLSAAQRRAVARAVASLREEEPG
jgi:cytochrome c-type biogenesis protein CcmH